MSGGVTPALSLRLKLRRPIMALAALMPFPLGVPLAVRAIPNGQITTPLPTRVERFNPDSQTCRPEAIRSGFASQLRPWADQPPAVLARLRELQRAMTRATLQRCVSKGLMEPAQASELEHQLISPAAPPGPAAPAPAGPAPPAP